MQRIYSRSHARSAGDTKQCDFYDAKSCLIRKGILAYNRQSPWGVEWIWFSKGRREKTCWRGKTKEGRWGERSLEEERRSWVASSKAAIFIDCVVEIRETW